MLLLTSQLYTRKTGARCPRLGQTGQNLRQRALRISGKSTNRVIQGPDKKRLPPPFALLTDRSRPTDQQGYPGRVRKEDAGRRERVARGQAKSRGDMVGANFAINGQP